MQNEGIGTYIRELGGNCPVQGWGTVPIPGFVDGRVLPWYFRARGKAWTLETEEEAGIPSVGVWCAYGPSYTAGWMEEAEQIVRAVAPILPALLALPNRRHEPEKDPPGKWEQEWNRMMKEGRDKAADVETILGLRARVKELETGAAAAEAYELGRRDERSLKEGEKHGA